MALAVRTRRRQLLQPRLPRPHPAFPSHRVFRLRQIGLRTDFLQQFSRLVFLYVFIMLDSLRVLRDAEIF